MDTMDGAEPPKNRLETTLPTVDSITQGIRNIPIRVDPGYRSDPSDSAADAAFAKR